MSDFININDDLPYSEWPESWWTPMGNNRNGSLQNYIQRKKYKDLPYFLLLAQPLDSWYDKNYFGRVDPVQNGIVVKKQESLLAQLQTERGNVFVLNFVAVAFEALRLHMVKALTTGAIQDERSFYTTLLPSAGLYDYERDIQNFTDSLLQKYSNRLIKTPAKYKKVVDFRSYVEYLLDFYDTKTSPGPITLSGYTVSRTSTPLMSGMAIELVSEDYSKDYRKFKKYIKDPNFRYFVQAARKYGFYVDRNGPWRLFADPFSNPMMYYLKQTSFGSTITKDNFFSSYYHKTYSLDLPKLQEDLVYMYNKFVENHPVIKEDWHNVHNLPPTTRCRDLEPKKTYRQAVTLNAVQDMGDVYWLDTYFKFRIKEGNLNFKDYDQRLRKAAEVYRVYGINKAMRFINNEVKPYLYNLNALRKDLTHVSTRGNLEYVPPQQQAPPPEWLEEIEEAFESGEMSWQTAIHTYS